MKQERKNPTPLGVGEVKKDCLHFYPYDIIAIS